jgi:osmoprotectant transport system ATP-binding protein
VSEGTAGAAVRLRDVAVRYPNADHDAVAGVDLDVPAGAFVVLLGPSGCGKSTLLRTINRLVVPYRGTIEADGNDVTATDAETLRRGIGYVIQAVGLFPHLTIAQNIAVVPQLLRWTPADIAARVDELLELVRLDPARYRARLPRELSGGEQQRVGVARALAARPRVLLMDEPFGAVDAIVRTSLQDETLRIHRVLGTTILFVTHDVDEALRLADRIVVMKEGRIEQDASPLQVLAKPATPYVEALLDAKDAIRRLSLLSARDALSCHPERRREAPESKGRRQSVNADASLRIVLSVLLEGADSVEVVDQGRVLGTLSFAEIRAALAASER